MKVLVTGGAGYVGNELIMVLVNNPDITEIVIYDNLSRKNYNLFLYGTYPSGKVRFINGELLDTRKIRMALQGIDVVYHLAAKVSTPFASEDSHLFEQVNHWGTAELVYAVEESNVKRFVYLSSISVYGSTDDTIHIDTLPNPKTFYGSSKLRGEDHVRRLSHKMPVFIFRCGNVWGISPSMRYDAVINRFMFEANFVGRISIHGDGKQTRAFIHVDKVVNILENILKIDFTPGTYNMVEDNFSINEITETLRKVYPDLEMIFINQHLHMRQLRVDPDRRIDVLDTFPDKSFLQRLVEFKNRFSFSV